MNSDRAEMVFPIGSKIVAQMRAGKFPGTGDGDKMSPFEWTFSMSPWEYYRAYPEQRITFDAYMAARRDGLRPKRFEVYPARRELCPAPHEGDTKATTLVDVGGNHGYDILDFQKRHPHIKGRFVLQDLSETLAGIKTPLECIEVMPYDIFTEQPIKGMIHLPLLNRKKAILTTFPHLAKGLEHICSKLSAMILPTNNAQNS